MSEVANEEKGEEENTTLSNSDVTTKYQEAAKISNAVLTEVIALCVPGAVVLDVCLQADASIVAKLATIYKQKKPSAKVFLFCLVFLLFVISFLNIGHR